MNIFSGIKRGIVYDDDRRKRCDREAKVQGKRFYRLFYGWDYYVPRWTKADKYDVDLICIQNNRMAEVELLEDSWHGGPDNWPFPYGLSPWMHKVPNFGTGFCDSLSFNSDASWLAFIQGERIPQYLVPETLEPRKAYKEGTLEISERFTVPKKEIVFIDMSKSLSDYPNLPVLPIIGKPTGYIDLLQWKKNRNKWKYISLPWDVL